MKKKSIFFLHNILWAAYKGEVFSQLHVGSLNQNFDIHFVQIAETSNERKGLGKIDLSFHRYPYKLLFRGALQSVSPLKRSWAVVREFLRKKHDIVVIPGYAELEYWALWLVCQINGTPVVIALDSTRHDNVPRWWTEILKKTFVSGCVGGFCYGSRSAKYLEELGMNRQAIYIRRQAAPNDYIRRLAATGTAHVPASIASAQWLLYVGRLSKEKDIKTLLSAMAEAKHKDLHLVLIGDGPEREALETLAEKLAMSSRTHFLGSKTLAEIAPYYVKALALVLPSLSEPWGLVVNEAMVLGCPVIVSDRCGCFPDLVQESISGFGFQAGSTTSLSQAIEKIEICSTDRDVLGENCKKLISGYSPEAVSKQMVSAFRAFLRL